MCILPARCRGVELRPCVSRQLMLSGLHNFCTLAKHPFLAASSSAASPLSRSWMSVSPSFTRSKGVLPSRFFLVGSAPCCREGAKEVKVSVSSTVSHVCSIPSMKINVWFRDWDIGVKSTSIDFVEKKASPSKSLIAKTPVETLCSDEEQTMTSDYWEVDKGNSPEKRRDGGVKKRGTEVKIGYLVKWKTPHTLEMREEEDIFMAQLSPSSSHNLSFHCRFWNPLIKFGCCGTTPLSIHHWPETVRYTSPRLDSHFQSSVEPVHVKSFCPTFHSCYLFAADLIIFSL